MFSGKSLVITGGTGSFGNAVLRRFLETDIAQIRVFSRDEKKQDEMRHQYRHDKLKFYIGDVRNEESLSDALEGADYVFHAAALKQVPSCEFYPMEAVRTNIVGTDNLLNAATRCGVRSVVVLSTDKAAYPVNAMGMSKGLMEKVAIARSAVAARKGCHVCVTRYGNVMASRGSVIPLFIDQIRQGLPLTITDPLMTRFMMSLDDAVDLVLYAFEHAEPGDLFVQKAPAATIETLAKALLRIFELDNPIQIIGTRHGEKLYETLLTREEMIRAEDLGNYFRVPADVRDLNYAQYFSEGESRLAEISDYHSHNVVRLELQDMIDTLLKLPYVQRELDDWHAAERGAARARRAPREAVTALAGAGTFRDPAEREPRDVDYRAPERPR